jgi:hypothetical protein
MYQTNCPDWLARLVPQWELEGDRVIPFNYDQRVELALLATTYLARLARGFSPFQTSWLDWLVVIRPDSPPGDVMYDQGVTGGKRPLGCVQPIQFGKQRDEYQWVCFPDRRRIRRLARPPSRPG